MLICLLFFCVFWSKMTKNLKINDVNFAVFSGLHPVHCPYLKKTCATSNSPRFPLLPFWKFLALTHGIWQIGLFECVPPRFSLDRVVAVIGKYIPFFVLTMRTSTRSLTLMYMFFRTDAAIWDFWTGQCLKPQQASASDSWMTKEVPCMSEPINICSMQ